MGKRIDLTGQKFGRLTVVDFYGSDKRRESIWRCQCECGNITNVLSSNLRKGYTKSCGCLQKEKAGKNTPIKDLSNMSFGQLTVLYPTSQRLNGQVVWHCKCTCGKEIDVRSNNLISGNTFSCGCLKQSHGEYLIEQLLQKNNMQYEKEKTFSSCIFNDTKQLARFDFYVNNQYIIEFDGEQHFNYTQTGWNTKEQFIKTKEHDNYKNQWCKENNIPIIRIPYLHEKDICLEDLLLETTNWRVV